MCSNGWSMTKFFAGLYWFEPCEKGKYTYQVDFRNNFFGVDNNYSEFMQDIGVEILQTWGFWVLLRRPVSMFLPFGLILNSCAMLLNIQDTMLPIQLIITLQIAAIVLMLVGVFRTSHNRNNNHT